MLHPHFEWTRAILVVDGANRYCFDLLIVHLSYFAIHDSTSDIREQNLAHLP